MATVDLVIQRMDELRRDRNLTWNALATSAGIAPSTLKSIYNGKSKNPGIITIKTICDGMGVSLTEFFGTSEFDNLEQEMK